VTVGEGRVPETIAQLLAMHRSGQRPVSETVARTYARLRAAGDPAIFIALREEAEVLAEAAALEGGGDRSLPLHGIPVAVKDNIDVAGLPTTAACPAFAYMPARDATCVARLREAGALIVGKTNLDQFATGLVGVRSPYGTPRNPLRADLIPGGSSSGSAVAVARGIVPLALATDTAGSGRVPAALINIVGLKPSLGLVPTAGVVPACRSLDCVSILALTTEDAFAALEVVAGPDERDPFTRAIGLGVLSAAPPNVRIGVPRSTDRVFLGDLRAEAAFREAERLVGALGASLVEVDLTPFIEVARLLYDGPWVAERTAAVGDFIAQRANEVHPITRTIIAQGMQRSAVEAFRGLYRLTELRTACRDTLAGTDLMMVPTIPAACTVAAVEADPIGLNSALGTYTNFVNLLDLAGLSVPVSLDPDGTPFGVTFLAPAGQDATIASFGAAFHALTGLPLGALDAPQPAFTPLPVLGPGEVAIAVVGAHMSGMPLNRELKGLAARFLDATTTAADYRLFALQDGSRPGLLRVPPGTGAAIEIELWALSTDAFGRFVAAVPPPLSIGSIRLQDGRLVKGFLAEAEGVRGARDITASGGWRAFVDARGSG
jgi:allophanate hydrolase